MACKHDHIFFEQIQSATQLDDSQVPEVVLIKKFWGSKADRAQRRRWRLKRLNVEMDNEPSVGGDFNDFCEDLEEDPAFRQHVNIYKDSKKIQVESVADEMPQISLQEMLEDMTLEDEPMDEAAQDDADSTDMNL